VFSLFLEAGATMEKRSRRSVRAALTIDLGLFLEQLNCFLLYLESDPDDLTSLPYSSTCLRMGTTVAPETTNAVELVLDENDLSSSSSTSFSLLRAGVLGRVRR
jgi:hypothetical protein